MGDLVGVETDGEAEGLFDGLRVVTGTPVVGAEEVTGAVVVVGEDVVVGTRVVVGLRVTGEDVVGDVLVGLKVVGGVGANVMPMPNVEKSPECKFLWQFAPEQGKAPQP